MNEAYEWRAPNGVRVVSCVPRKRDSKLAALWSVVTYYGLGKRGERRCG